MLENNIQFQLSYKFLDGVKVAMAIACHSTSPPTPVPNTKSMKPVMCEPGLISH